MFSAVARADGPRLIDVDYWPWKVTMGDVAPFLPEARRSWLRLDEAASREVLPESRHFVCARHLRDAESALAAREAAVRHLDEKGIDCAVLNLGAASAASGYANPVFAGEIARAVNEWTAQEWLGRDARLRGSIVVSSRDPSRAAAEIVRASVDPRMVRVLLSYPHYLLGSRMLYPIWEAAIDADLPVTIEAGGAYAGANAGLTTLGDAESVFESFVSWEFAAQPHLISMITRGVFARFPELRIVFSGFGIAWLPSILWRLDQEMRLGRVPVPVMEISPTDQVRKHVRFTVAPVELAASKRDTRALLELVDAAQLLLFSSGSEGADDALAVLELLDDNARGRVATYNAVAWFPLHSQDHASPRRSQSVGEMVHRPL